MTVVKTQAGIVGAGPGGLMLSHLLAAEGIESIVLERRGREEIENTVRAGILEAGTVQVVSESGASDRVLREGRRHEGIELRFDGEGHRIDFDALVGRNVWPYPQHEVLTDLIVARLAGGPDLRFEVEATSAEDDGERAAINATGRDGEPLRIEAELVVGADGSRSVVRTAVSGSQTDGHFREYPLRLVRDPLPRTGVLRFRSFVASQIQRGRLALIGDTAHTVPPTGAKGLNLAVADVVGASRALKRLLGDRDASEIQRYPEIALRRTWKARHFSWWVTSMLHSAPGASAFDRMRQLGELNMVVESEAGRSFLAEAIPVGHHRVDPGRAYSARGRKLAIGPARKRRRPGSEQVVGDRASGLANQSLVVDRPGGLELGSVRNAPRHGAVQDAPRDVDRQLGLRMMDVLAVAQEHACKSSGCRVGLLGSPVPDGRMEGRLGHEHPQHVSVHEHCGRGSGHDRLDPLPRSQIGKILNVGNYVLVGPGHLLLVDSHDQVLTARDTGID